MWMPLEEPLVLTTYRSCLDVQEALSDWFGASASLFYSEASFSTRQVIETEMSILTPAEEKATRCPARRSNALSGVEARIAKSELTRFSALQL